MKTKLVGIMVIVAGVLGIGYSQYGGGGSSFQISKENPLAASGGRYVFGEVGGIAILMLDTQDGRLWKFDTMDNHLQLEPIAYRGLDGTYTTVPSKNEETENVVFNTTNLP